MTPVEDWTAKVSFQAANGLWHRRPIRVTQLSAAGAVLEGGELPPRVALHVDFELAGSMVLHAQARVAELDPICTFIEFTHLPEPGASILQEVLRDGVEELIHAHA